MTRAIRGTTGKLPGDGAEGGGGDEPGILGQGAGSERDGTGLPGLEAFFQFRRAEANKIFLSAGFSFSITH